jgi:integrase
MRAEELYQLELKDIDLQKRTVKISHNPSSGQTTKTGKSRISFFNKEAWYALQDYF